jgi:hypothetical protein
VQGDDPIGPVKPGRRAMARCQFGQLALHEPLQVAGIVLPTIEEADCHADYSDRAIDFVVWHRVCAVAAVECPVPVPDRSNSLLTQNR